MKDTGEKASPKLLFLAANPQGMAYLDLEGEAARIREALEQSGADAALEMIVNKEARPLDLFTGFNRWRPTIVHFSGNGDEDEGLVFLDSGGQRKTVGAVDLAKAFAELRDQVRVVVLNACFSRLQALAIAEHIDCVIGMKSRITDEQAIAFSSTLYSALGFGASVRQAFGQARAALGLEQVGGEKEPELLSRVGVDPATIFVVGTGVTADPSGPRNPAVEPNLRFAVALSFAGENRNFVQEVAGYLANKLGRDKILYDRYHEAEFGRPNLETYLQQLYHDDSELVVVFLSADYEHKEWCGLEWRAVRDLLKRKRATEVMPIRFDTTEIPGFFSIDGYVWIGDREPSEVAELILTRLALNRGEPLRSSTGISLTPASGPHLANPTSVPHGGLTPRKGQGEAVLSVVIPQVTLEPEDFPGGVAVKVRNLAQRSSVSATAQVKEVRETVQNPHWPQTYALRWRSSGLPERSLARGACDALVIAKLLPTLDGLSRPIYEASLEGYVEGAAAMVDQRRWHGGEPEGTLTFVLEVEVTTDSAEGTVSKVFEVYSKKWGGLGIREQTASVP